MTRSTIVTQLLETKVVAVIRMKEDDAKATIDSIIRGGITNIEVTMTMANSLELIRELNKKHENQNVRIGVGTVIDETSARLAILAGAKFVVSPIFSVGIAELCNLYQIPYIPGVANPQDVYEALKHGSELLKIFPASQFQTNIVKELQGPFPQAQFMISGKVDANNIKTWLQQGASVVCLGSVLTNQGANADVVAQGFLEIIGSLD